jgi:predicted lipoprotein with Yx(FWY)xxD motif
MLRRLPILIACAAFAVAALAVGCGSDDSDDSSGERAAPAGNGSIEREAAGDEGMETGAGASQEAAAKPPRGPRVVLRESQFGPVLFDAGNRALYLFTRDPKRQTRCYGACAEAWPPFYAKGRPRAGRGVKESLLGTIKRRDGRRQVTYKGQALYFYVADPKGEVLCNDVFEFGGTWFAVDAEGNRPA